MRGKREKTAGLVPQVLREKRAPPVRLVRPGPTAVQGLQGKTVPLGLPVQPEPPGLRDQKAPQDPKAIRVPMVQRVPRVNLVPPGLRERWDPPALLVLLGPLDPPALQALGGRREA